MTNYMVKSGSGWISQKQIRYSPIVYSIAHWLWG